MQEPRFLSTLSKVFKSEEDFTVSIYNLLNHTANAKGSDTVSKGRDFHADLKVF